MLSTSHLIAGTPTPLDAVEKRFFGDEAFEGEENAQAIAALKKRDISVDLEDRYFAPLERREAIDNGAPIAEKDRVGSYEVVVLTASRLFNLRTPEATPSRALYQSVDRHNGPMAKLLLKNCERILTPADWYNKPPPSYLSPFTRDCGEEDGHHSHQQTQIQRRACSIYAESALRLPRHPANLSAAYK
ncbi:hypothetical protein MBM_05884 [Drepanopeziza brunnea f. sp. 'multigermtubi' MB_m1]|uniref:Uncharacterized protein n=1 Tax=Marssonina brunnea f. sp. multigermtubi (strain MB_m1) TaxID=1072389 RepID=K1X5F6_MARBU|nr:uncharacterized protein MBM_05884 [Drepanopeziza brunnea f. sp. 'multigermtubi' MB_m1]EKD15873.1 hypothetical protein MBM_05884 [Drepanopeziza brunnea f. sp. 'multigermtubi' MB_m1]